MRKLSLFVIPLILLSACDREKTYIVGEDAFCIGLEETSPEKVYCVDANDTPINGNVTEYRANGTILREMTIKDGYENGMEREYYENGNLHVETNVVDGNADGLSKLYNEDGTLYMELEWVNGNTTNIKVYDPSGNIISSSDLVD